MKLQNPKSKLQIKSELQASIVTRGRAPEILDLEFYWNLELGTWNF
jgi:hypothetical protein